MHRRCQTRRVVADLGLRQPQQVSNYSWLTCSLCLGAAYPIGYLVICWQRWSLMRGGTTRDARCCLYTLACPERAGSGWRRPRTTRRTSALSIWMVGHGTSCRMVCAAWTWPCSSGSIHAVQAACKEYLASSWDDMTYETGLGHFGGGAQPWLYRGKDTGKISVSCFVTVDSAQPARACFFPAPPSMS